MSPRCGRKAWAAVFRNARRSLGPSRPSAPTFIRLAVGPSKSQPLGLTILISATRASLRRADGPGVLPHQLAQVLGLTVLGQVTVQHPLGGWNAAIQSQTTAEPRQVQFGAEPFGTAQVTGLTERVTRDHLLDVRHLMYARRGFGHLALWHDCPVHADRRLQRRRVAHAAQSGLIVTTDVTAEQPPPRVANRARVGMLAVQQVVHGRVAAGQLVERLAVRRDHAGVTVLAGQHLAQTGLKVRDAAALGAPGGVDGAERRQHATGPGGHRVVPQEVDRGPGQVLDRPRPGRGAQGALEQLRIVAQGLWFDAVALPAVGKLADAGSATVPQD